MEENVTEVVKINGVVRWQLGVMKKAVKEGVVHVYITEYYSASKGTKLANFLIHG